MTKCSLEKKNVDVATITGSDHNMTLHTTTPRMSMSPGPTDLAVSHPDFANLTQIDTIPASTSPQELLRCILGHEKAGTPLVVTGIDSDSHWHSQYSSVLGGTTPVDFGTGDF